MVKVKVIKEYNDMQLKKVQDKIGTEFEVDKERAEYLVNQGMVEIVDKVKPDVAKK